MKGPGHKSSAAGEKKEAAASGDDGDRLETALLHTLRRLTSAPLDAGLYIVATPIGNLGDISVRALAVLRMAAVVVCEDTRHTKKLLSAYGLRKRLDIYHDFSGDADRERLAAYVRTGMAVALVSDAGMPLIADPGYKLVRKLLSERLPVSVIPGPSAAIAALVLSGLPSDRFSFGGFLPATAAARAASLQDILALPGTAVVYETGPRLKRTLGTLDDLSPNRQIAVARELTKLHEEVVRGTPAELMAHFGSEPPKGEIVLLLGSDQGLKPAETEIRAALAKALKTGSLKDAVENVTKTLGVQKKHVYNLALKLEKKNG